jgi:hypothetical protein
MVFGPSRPPITEDVAEVIAKDVKQGEGHSETSESPIAFVHHPGNPVQMNGRVRWLFLGTVIAIAVLLAILVLR